MQSRFLLQLLVVASLAIASPTASFAQTADSTANNFLKQGDDEWAKGDLPSAFKSWTEAAKVLKGESSAEFTKRDLAVLRGLDGSVLLSLLHPAIPTESRGPAYPVSLRNSGVEGSVVTAFIVNADGRVDVTSFKVLRSDHPLFSESVREALPKLRFKPAQIQGRKVPQLLERPFNFTISRE